ncbi:hypothetical protein Vretimale_14591, partial [Volvox reticuliferus]
PPSAPLHTAVATITNNLLLNQQSPLRHVDAVQELADIQDTNAAGLANEGGRAGYVLQVVAGQDQLILHAIRAGNLHALQHVNYAHALLAQEIADLHLLALVLDVDIDGKVSVH